MTPTSVFYGLILTFLVYCLPIVIYRYSIRMKPLDPSRAKAVTIIFGIIAFIVMNVILFVLDGSSGGQSILLWSFINYNILTSGYVEPTIEKRESINPSNTNINYSIPISSSNSGDPISTTNTYNTASMRSIPNEYKNSNSSIGSALNRVASIETANLTQHSAAVDDLSKRKKEFYDAIKTTFSISKGDADLLFNQREIIFSTIETSPSEAITKLNYYIDGWISKGESGYRTAVFLNGIFSGILYSELECDKRQDDIRNKYKNSLIQKRGDINRVSGSDKSEKAVFCHKCGAKLREGSSFCHRCGEKIR